MNEDIRKEFKKDFYAGGEYADMPEGEADEIVNWWLSKFLKIKEECKQLPDTYEDEESKVFKTTKNEILAILNNHTR